MPGEYALVFGLPGMELDCAGAFPDETYMSVSSPSVIPPPEKLLRSKRKDLENRGRVVDAVRAWFDSQRWEAGSRLPSIREIAQLTNASPSSVYLIIRQLAEEGKIRTELGSGSFFVGHSGQNRSFRIALNIPGLDALPHEDHWKNSIMTGILTAASQHESRMMIMPCSIDSYDAQGVNKEILAERDEADALILFPTWASDAVRRAYENAGKFVVDLNSPDESVTANFVSPDYLATSFRIGQALVRAGRKRILFISHSPLEESVSARQRVCGMVGGVGEALGGSVQCRVIVSTGAREMDGADAMTKLLEAGNEVPDAVYCVGDDQAMGALKAVREAGIRVPEDMSILSGTGLEIEAYSGLTRTRQPFREIGRAIVNMVAERLRIQRSVPAVYLPMDIILGNTTTAEENALLGARPL